MEKAVQLSLKAHDALDVKSNQIGAQLQNQCHCHTEQCLCKISL